MLESQLGLDIASFGEAVLMAPAGSISRRSRPRAATRVRDNVVVVVVVVVVADTHVMEAALLLCGVAA